MKVTSMAIDNRCDFNSDFDFLGVYDCELEWFVCVLFLSGHPLLCYQLSAVCCVGLSKSSGPWRLPHDWLFFWIILLHRVYDCFQRANQAISKSWHAFLSTHDWDRSSLLCGFIFSKYIRKSSAQRIGSLSVHLTISCVFLYLFVVRL